MSKAIIETTDYVSDDENDECNGMCDDECPVCLYEEEKNEMILENRIIDCLADMREYMDTNYAEAGKKISVIDLKKLIKK